MVPVITDFDPRFNNSKPLWFEKLYQPFLRGDLRARCWPFPVLEPSPQF